jgi:hypothetical protein
MAKRRNRKDRTNATRPNGRGKALALLEPSQAAFDAFAPDARAIDPREIQPMEGDVERAFHNARVGVAAVFARETDFRNDLPHVDPEPLRTLPDLARAVAFAAERAAAGKPNASDSLETRARKLRKLLFKSASALVETGVLPAHELERLSGGKDARSVAGDCVKLSTLLHANADRIRGKTALKPEHLHDAAQAGSELTRRLDDGERLDTESAKELRDRLWTLLAQRHDRLWRVGAFLFGRKKADKRVPPLDARVKRKRAQPASA